MITLELTTEQFDALEQVLIDVVYGPSFETLPTAEAVALFDLLAQVEALFDLLVQV